MPLPAATALPLIDGQALEWSMIDDNLDVVGSSISQSPVWGLSDQGALIRGIAEPAPWPPLTHQTGQASPQPGGSLLFKLERCLPNLCLPLWLRTWKINLIDLLQNLIATPPNTFHKICMTTCGPDVWNICHFLPYVLCEMKTQSESLEDSCCGPGSAPEARPGPVIPNVYVTSHPSGWLCWNK